VWANLLCLIDNVNSQLEGKYLRWWLPCALGVGAAPARPRCCIDRPSSCCCSPAPPRPHPPSTPNHYV
jgi:hypothetical protein